MAGSHVVVARYDLLAHRRPRQRLHLHRRPRPGRATWTRDAVAVDPARRTPTDAGRRRADRRPNPSATAGRARALPEVAIPPWDGKERLNILLIGADQRPSEGTFNTDTLIVVSIDPVTKQVAMFSLPRDTVDVPIPPGPARQRLRAASTRGKINAWWTSIRNRSDLFPGNEQDARLQRPQGDPRQPLRARHQVLRRGQLRRLQEGRRRDGRRDHQRPDPGLGRPLPVDRRAASGGSTSRAGIQHMNGAEALRYARSRHGSNDFDRGAAPAAASCSRCASRPTRRT